MLPTHIASGQGRFGWDQDRRPDAPEQRLGDISNIIVNAKGSSGQRTHPGQQSQRSTGTAFVQDDITLGPRATSTRDC
jgi:hypothetical protein